MRKVCALWHNLSNYCAFFVVNSINFLFCDLTTDDPALTTVVRKFPTLRGHFSNFQSPQYKPTQLSFFFSRYMQKITNKLAARGMQPFVCFLFYVSKLHNSACTGLPWLVFSSITRNVQNKKAVASSFYAKIINVRWKNLFYPENKRNFSKIYRIDKMSQTCHCFSAQDYIASLQ